MIGGRQENGRRQADEAGGWSGSAAIEGGRGFADDAAGDEIGLAVARSVVGQMNEDSDSEEQRKKKQDGVGDGVEPVPERVARLLQLEQGAVSFGLTVVTVCGVSGWALKSAMTAGLQSVLALVGACIGGYLALFAMAWAVTAKRRLQSGRPCRAMAELRAASVLLPVFGSVWGIDGFRDAIGPCLAGAVWLGGVADGGCMARIAEGRLRAIGPGLGLTWRWWDDWLNERLPGFEPMDRGRGPREGGGC